MIKHNYNNSNQKQTRVTRSMSSIKIPHSLQALNNLQPIVKLVPLHLHTAASFTVPSLSINKCFLNGPKVVLSPLKSAIRSNVSYNIRSFNRRHRSHYIINKCNAKRCLCCNHISCKSNIKSSVNGRTFNVNILSDID
jgi:hypothetical protein